MCFISLVCVLLSHFVLSLCLTLFDEKHQDCETVDSGLLYIFSEQGPGHFLPAESLVVWISSEAGSVSGAHSVHRKPHQSHVRGGNKAASIVDNSIFTIIEQRMP